jgi:hypothetical protein
MKKPFRERKEYKPKAKGKNHSNCFEGLVLETYYSDGGIR